MPKVTKKRIARSSKTGKIVSKDYAQKHPSTTQVETRKVGARSALDELRAERTVLRGQVTRLTKRVEALESENANLEARVKVVVAERGALKREARDAEVPLAESQAAAAAAESESLLTQLAETKAQLEWWKSQAGTRGVHR